ncbi:MAG: ElyC/SanA/YdcF family protein [Anaerovoracaceae bacterium]
MRIMKKIRRFIAFLIVLLLIPVFINYYVILESKPLIAEPAKVDILNIDPQCILVLGAGVTGNLKPSPMLKDRLDTAILLYEEGIASKLLLSGDHGKPYYDEVNTMLNYCLERDIPKEDIFLDHAGFSTYDSVVRAKKIFQVERMIIVTQRYHLYRALFISQKLGMQAIGVSSTLKEYKGQWAREKREFLARNKDFYQTLAWPDPRYLGDIIPITGDSLLSYD